MISNHNNLVPFQLNRHYYAYVVTHQQPRIMNQNETGNSINIINGKNVYSIDSWATPSDFPGTKLQ